MAAHRIANAAYTQQDPLLTVLGCEMAVRLAIRTDPFVNSARCHGGLAVLLGLSGMTKPSVALFERSIQEAESLDDLEGLTYTLYSRALVNAGLGGNWDQVDADVERAFELAERLGNIQEQQVILIIAAGSHNLQGDFEGSYRDLQRLLDTALPRRHQQHTAWAYDMQAWVRARQGRFEEAAERAGRFLALFPEVKGDGVSVLNAAMAAVYVPAFLGDRREAVANLAEAERAIKALRAPLWAEVLPLDVFGDALDELQRQTSGGRDAKAIERTERVYLKALTSHARRMSNSGAIALFQQGRAALRSGRPAKAERLAKAAFRRATELGCPFDVARARLLFVQIDGGGSQTAKEHARAAATEFEHCGAVGYLNRLREVT